MDLINDTPVQAAFVNTVVGEDHLLGAVVAKGVFRLEAGRLRHDPERRWPAGGLPVPTPFGEIEGDGPFLKDGVDLIVLGNAYPPGGGAGTEAAVSVRVGAFRYDVRVIGDRTWGKRGRSLTPSPPQPFESMPLTWDRAFGGKAKVPPSAATSPLMLEVPYAANPDGRGYCLDEEMASGTMLPNLEDPANPIRAWNDWPSPAGVGPYKREWALRALRSIEYDSDAVPPRIRRILPAYYNNAHPGLVLKPEPVPGDPISVSGIRPGGLGLQFAFPDLSFHVYVQLGDRPYVFPAHLDTVIVLAEEERVVLGYRCVFRYRMVPLERRAAVLRVGHRPSVPPETYRIDWDALDRQERARA